VGRPGPEERGRRVVLAQGLAALACFIAVQGAHAATLPYTSAGTPGHDYLLGTEHADVILGGRGNGSSSTVPAATRSTPTTGSGPRRWRSR
jgi:hypothetical protein